MAKVYPLTAPCSRTASVNSLFGGEIRKFCPVSILQGMEDPDVPWRHTMQLVEISPPIR